MNLARRLFLTALAAALVAYVVASIWCPVPIAQSISWLWDALLIVRDVVGSTAITVVVAVPLVWMWCNSIGTGLREGRKCARLGLCEPPKNPYPEVCWTRISCFRYESDLHLMRFAEGLKGVARKDQYIVTKPYTVSFMLDDVKNGGVKRYSVTVPKGMLTDLSSVPFPLNCVVGRVGPHLEATVVHDYLYVAWQDHECETGSKANRKREREFADKLLLEGMKAAGMHCKAYLIYWVIWIGGGPIFRGRNPIRYVDLGECGCGKKGGCEGGGEDTCPAGGSSPDSDSADDQEPSANDSTS